MLLSVSLQECYNKVEAEFMEKRTPQVSQQSGKLVSWMFVEDIRRDILKDAISSLGGYQAEVFNIQVRCRRK